LRTGINVATNWALYFANIVVAFFLSPYMVRMLGDSSFGAWNILISLTGYMGLVDLGTRSAVVKYAAEYYAKKEYKTLVSVFYSSFISVALGGSILLVGALAVRGHAASWLGMSGPLGELFAAAIFPSALAIVLTISKGIILGHIAGVGRYDLSNLVASISLAIRTGGIVFFLSRGGSLPELAWVLVTVAAVTVPIAFLILRSLVPTLSFSVASLKTKQWRQVIGYGFFAFLNQMAARISRESDNIIVGAAVSTTATAYYAIGINLASYVKTFISSAAVVAIPLTSGMEARQDSEGQRRVTVLGTRFALCVALCGTVGFFILGRDFLTLWLGERFAANTWPTGFTLFLALVFASSQQFAGAMLFGRGRARFPAVVMVISAVVNLGLSILLVQRMGVMGVALGTLISAVVLEFGLISLYYTPKILGSPRLSYLRETWVGPLVCLVPSLACGWIARSFIDVSGYLQLLEVAAVIAAGCFLPAWWICLNGEERASVSARLADWKKK
jgi:O-antigen/teichoic acid export membrane protein